MAESLGVVELGIKVEQDQALRDLKRFGDQAERSAGGAARGFKELNDELKLSETVLGALSGALGTLAVGEFLRQSVQAAVQLETVTRKLSNSLGEQGAAGALNFTRGLADQLGLSFSTLTNTFASFTAAATAAGVPIETQRDLFASVSKAAQVLGLSNDELSGSLLALQQVASKGTVQMEELRGQLGERLPIAFAAAARGLGLTQQELIALVESGKLTSTQFFPALTKGLNDLITSTEGAPTAAQNIAQFTNAIEDLKTSLGQGLLPVITPVLKELTDRLNDLANARTATNTLGIGSGLAVALRAASEEQIKVIDGQKEIQTKFNLTDQELRKLFRNAATEAGGVINPFGDLFLSASQLEAVMKRLPQLAKEYRDANPDVRGQAIAQENAAKAALEQQKKGLDSINNLNAALKQQRDQLNGVAIGSQRFNELSASIGETQRKLEEATRAAAGTGRAIGEIQARISTQGLDFKQQDVGVAQSRLQIAQQTAQAEQDLGNARLNLELQLLSAQEKRALEGVQNDRDRQAIQEEFQRRREEIEQRQLDLREAATRLELQQKTESLKLEGQITELAARRAVIQASIALLQAQKTQDPQQIAAAQEVLGLAQRELQVVQQINLERLKGQEKVNALRLQQLEVERRAAQADNLPPLQTGGVPSTQNILDFKAGNLQLDQNTDVVKKASEQISSSNDGLSEQIALNTKAIRDLADKNWQVSLQVDNEAGGNTTINTMNALS